MAREAAYWTEFQSGAIKKGIARTIPECGVIEVLAPVLILVNWRTRRQVIWEGKVIREYWREDWGLVEYKPGQVLRREWRAASDWEIEEWKSLSEERLRGLAVFQKDGELSVLIVEKIEDLPAAIRQLGRHIPGRKIIRPRKKFVLAGDAQVLADYAGRLSKLLQNSLAVRKPGPRLVEESSLALAQLSLLLERSRTFLKRRALGEIKLAQQERFWEVSARTGRVMADLLQQRAEDYEIAIKSIELAEKLCDLTAKIERRFRDCYNRLGQLGEKLQGLLATGKAVESKDLLPIANEAQGIWKHLMEKVPNFNPYYWRLQAPEFQRLSRVVSHAEAGRAETVFNDIEEATTKLEAVAIGEKVTGAELRRERETLV